MWQEKPKTVFTYLDIVIILDKEILQFLITLHLYKIQLLLFMCP